MLTRCSLQFPPRAGRFNVDVLRRLCLQDHKTLELISRKNETQHSDSDNENEGGQR